MLKIQDGVAIGKKLAAKQRNFANHNPCKEHLVFPGFPANTVPKFHSGPYIEKQVLAFCVLYQVNPIVDF